MSFWPQAAGSVHSTSFWLQAAGIFRSMSFWLQAAGSVCSFIVWLQAAGRQQYHRAALAAAAAVMFRQTNAVWALFTLAVGLHKLQRQVQGSG